MVSRLPLILAAFVALGLPGEAKALSVQQLFPFSAANEAEAVRFCGGLMDVAQIVQASHGALVFFDIGGKSAVIANSEIAQFAAAIRDPSDNAWPVVTKIESRPGRYVEVLARRAATDHDHGSVRCWWAKYGPVLRLTAIELAAGS
ncbi:MAG: hypothetical protein EPN75_08750 [Beijerinckiaceae bacterium]|nr:MAG: hypothetical protein EPN75_08750 [Beijerinckiaceae bacterium]